jgi:hypothetical protein
MLSLRLVYRYTNKQQAVISVYNIQTAIAACAVSIRILSNTARAAMYACALSTFFKQYQLCTVSSNVLQQVAILYTYHLCVI